MNRFSRIVALVLVVLFIFTLVGSSLVYASAPVRSQSIKENVHGISTHKDSNTNETNAITGQNDDKNSQTKDFEVLKKNENLLVIGVGGLRLEDINAQLKYYKLDNLKKFIEESALANNIVRSITSSTCTADGWLALNTGKRFGDAYRGGVGICANFASPYDSNRIHDWNAYKQSESENNYHAELGSLKKALSKYKVKPIGLGAAVALAGSDGKIRDFSHAHSNDNIFAKQIASEIKENKVVIADAGQIRPYQRVNVRAYSVDSYAMSKERGTNSRRQYTQEKMLKRGGIDYTDTPLATHTYKLLKRLDTILSYQSENQNIVLASLSDSGPIPHLQMVAFRGPVFKEKGFIKSSSTRHIGLIQNEDIYKKILSLLGESDVEVLSTVSSKLPTFRQEDLKVDAPQAYVGSKANVLIDRAVHADRIKRTAPPFLLYMVSITAILFISIGAILNKRFINLAKRYFKKDLSEIATSLRTWKVLRFVSIVVACVPINGLIYNLLPWWQHRGQEIGTILVPTLMSVIVACVCSIGKLKNSLVAPLILVSLIHVVALTIDPLIGNQMLLDSVLGSQSILGARMYGFGNIMFALFASATLMLGAALCEKYVRRKSKLAIFATLFILMAYSTVIDGLPKFGADFGGPPAIIPGFVFLILILLEVKLSWKRIVGVFAFTGIIVLGICLFDWMRPATQRTHLGNFMQVILDGGLWPVVYRKLGANVNMLTSPLIVIAIAGAFLIVYIMFFPHMKKNVNKNIDTYRWLISDYTDKSVDQDLLILKPMILSLFVMLFIGGSVNDSGIVIPGNALVLIVPMCLSIWLTWMINIKMQNSSIVG